MPKQSKRSGDATSGRLVSGLASVTFRTLAPEEIVAEVQAAGLRALEWGGDVHVVPGELRRARDVAAMTREAGLVIAGYGSYFRLASNELVEPWIETAEALGAPTMRVWAGVRGSQAVSAVERAGLVERLRHTCARAAEHGLTVSLEFHENTLADSASALVALIREVDHPALRTYWQMPVECFSLTELRSSVRAVQPWLTNLHVFNREPCTHTWGALSVNPWRDLLSIVAERPDPHTVLIEFVRGQSRESFREDAATLRAVLAEIERAKD